MYARKRVYTCSYAREHTGAYPYVSLYLYMCVSAFVCVRSFMLMHAPESLAYNTLSGDLAGPDPVYPPVGGLAVHTAGEGGSGQSGQREDGPGRTGRSAGRSPLCQE